MNLYQTSCVWDCGGLSSDTPMLALSFSITPQTPVYCTEQASPLSIEPLHDGIVSQLDRNGIPRTWQLCSTSFRSLLCSTPTYPMLGVVTSACPSLPCIGILHCISCVKSAATLLLNCGKELKDVSRYANTGLPRPVLSDTGIIWRTW